MPSPIQRLYRRLRFGPPIVVVSGLPRSGTSMLMKMLEAGGLSVMTDGQRTADEDNPKGYFEVERIKGLAQEGERGWLAGARGKAIKIISYLLRSLPPQFNYRVVFVRRDLDEVLASQSKMMARRGETDQIPPAKMRELLREGPGAGAGPARARAAVREPGGRSRRHPGASPRGGAAHRRLRRRAAWTCRPWPRPSTPRSTGIGPRPGGKKAAPRP